MRAALVPLLFAFACNENGLILRDTDVPPEPDITFSPTRIALGQHYVAEVVESELVLENVGGAELTVNSVKVVDFAHETAVILDATPFLPPQSKMFITLSTVVSASTGQDNGVVRVRSDDPDSPLIEIPISVKVVGEQPPAISLTPERFNFGAVAVGDTETKGVVVKNEGTGDLTISGFSWNSSSPSELRLSVDGKLGSGAVLGPGETRDLEVTYAPDDATPDDATLTVFSDDPGSPEITGSFFGG